MNFDAMYDEPQERHDDAAHCPIHGDQMLDAYLNPNAPFTSRPIFRMTCGCEITL